MLIRERLSQFDNKVLRSKAGLWFPGIDLLIPRRHNCLAIVEGLKGRKLHGAHNLVTTAGDVWYAQSAMGDSITTVFINLYMSSVAWTTPTKITDTDDIVDMSPAAGDTEKAPSATYPKTNDGDADNTGAGLDVATWLFEYTKADFNDPSIIGAGIAAAAVTSWGAAGGTDPVLNAFDFTAFEKTATDTLKVFVNHAFEGV
ncbi:hypothetical protein LCGC14_1906150 [marine sediment metagenome]|uniref:Uncharacterized protein n=1 Tax=marine sediment metagenome TaxID=412755 RepID=A0A0F9ITA2_9ZZZZ